MSCTKLHDGHRERLRKRFQEEGPVLISEGAVKEAAVYPRHVVEEAIRHRTASVILAHNHPAGTTKPSQQDHQLTRLLVQALGPLKENSGRWMTLRSNEKTGKNEPDAIFRVEAMSEY